VLCILAQEYVDGDNPLPGLIDPITLEPVVTPAISPYGHVMGLATWTAVLAERGQCPFTQQPLRRDQVGWVPGLAQVRACTACPVISQRDAACWTMHPIKHRPLCHNAASHLLRSLRAHLHACRTFLLAHAVCPPRR